MLCVNWNKAEIKYLLNDKLKHKKQKKIEMLPWHFIKKKKKEKKKTKAHNRIARTFKLKWKITANSKY